MPLSYAGIALPLLTPEVDLHLRQYHPNYDDFEDANVWHYDASGLEHLPLPPPPLDLPFEVGKLVWPTGMSRCAVARYVVDSDSFAEIRTALGSASAGPATLSVGDGTNTKTFSLYLVNYRPLFQIDGQKQLFLITLADSRWFLRTKTGSVTSTPASWSSLLSSLASSLGVTLTPDAIDADYGEPTQRWVVYEKPLSVLLDAAVNAIGHRLVANTDGTFKTQTYATARTEADNQFGDFSKTCGGFLLDTDLVRSVPASVKVVFDHIGSASPHTITKTLSGLAIADYGAATGVASQTATVYAEIAYDGTNATTVGDYATQAATDWYNWHLCDLDVTYAGVAEWVPTACEDRIEWRYEADRILTRVVRPPMQVLPAGNFDTNPPEGPDDGGGADCGWLAGLTEDDCLVMEVEEVYGTCSSIDDTTSLVLRWDAGASNWQSEANAFVYDCIASPGTVVFTFASPADPTLTIDGVAGWWTGDCVEGKLIFAFGGDTLCCGLTEAECQNYFTVSLRCACCVLDGYDGEGWYCVRDAGTSDACTPVELLEEDRCDPTIEICSGPYATLELAEAVCGTILTDCCGATEVPATLTADFSANAPDPNVTLTHNGTLWTGTGTLCGFSGTHTFACVGPGNNWTYTFTRDIGGGKSGSASATCDPFSCTVTGLSPFAEPENTCTGIFSVTIS